MLFSVLKENLHPITDRCQMLLFLAGPSVASFLFIHAAWLLKPAALGHIGNAYL